MRFCESPKGCKYPVFSTDKITRKGYCRSCATKYRTDLDRRSIIQKAMAKQKSLSTKIRSLQNDPSNLAILEEKGIVKNNDLELWFLHRMNTLQPICANCGKIGEYLLEEKNNKLWRSCQGHLLPKRHFKSISSHPLNGLVLGSGFSGLCHCHDTYDSNWLAASKMDIWQEVCNRFLILYPLINQKEYQFIPKQLTDLL